MTGEGEREETGKWLRHPRQSQSVHGVKAHRARWTVEAKESWSGHYRVSVRRLAGRMCLFR